MEQDSTQSLAIRVKTCEQDERWKTRAHVTVSVCPQATMINRDVDLDLETTVSTPADKSNIGFYR